MIHLAALQVPFCRADPPLGARVNVLGTVNVFEAAKARPQLAPIVYASSIAAFDANGTMAGHPSTIYGVYKRANESTARRLPRRERRLEHGPAAAHGLRRRPRPGRDLGADDRDARRRGRRCRSRSRTAARAQLQLARDVARAFIAASLAGHAGRGRAQPARAAASRSRRSSPRSAPTSIGFDDVRLPFPEEVDSASFTAALPRLRRDAARRRRRGDGRPLPRPPRRGPRPTTIRARSLMSNQSFRDDWQTRFGRPEPKVVCVGLNYSDHTGESQMRGAEGAAPLRQVREHALRGRRRDRAAGRRRARRRGGRAGGRDRPHRERRRRRTTRSSSSTGWTCANDVVGARLPVRRRPVVPRQEPRHVLPGRPARRAARRARLGPTCGSSSG